MVEYGLIGDPCTPNSPDVKHWNSTLRPEVTSHLAGAEPGVPWEEFLERDCQHGFPLWENTQPWPTTTILPCRDVGPLVLFGPL